MDDATATGRGHGKLIVFGEHTVVYDRPAVATGLSAGASATVSTSGEAGLVIDAPGDPPSNDFLVTQAGREILEHFPFEPGKLRIEVDIEIPVGVGLGSSAAMAVAISRALARLADLDGPDAKSRIEEAVAASEAVFHGSPSGIDRRAAIDGGFFSFHPAGSQPEITELDVPAKTWLVARVGPASPTAEMVEAVNDYYTRQMEFLDGLFDNAADIARRGADALERGDWETVGDLMNRNHTVLEAIEVSTNDLDTACIAARDAGALGAKLTGAGGGGCIVALPPTAGIDDVEAALEDHGDVYRFEL